MLTVIDIYKSVQDEGLDIGLPTVFVNFYDKNLNSVNKKHKLLMEEDVFYKVKAFENINGVCLTGGEIFKQDNTSLEGLLFDLAGEGKLLTIKINGNVFSKFDLTFVKCISISPNLTSVNSSGGKKVNINSLKKFLDYYKHKIVLNFVISNQKNWDEMVLILNKVKSYFPKVMVQPSTKKSDSFESKDRAFKKLLLLLNKNSLVVSKHNIKINFANK